MTVSKSYDIRIQLTYWRFTSISSRLSFQVTRAIKLLTCHHLN